MRIADVMEKVFQVRTFKNRINVISKLFQNFWACSAVDIVAHVHEPVYKFVLWLKMLDLPLQRHHFVVKTENQKCTKWLLKPD